MTPTEASFDDDLRERARKRLKKRRDFGAHVLVFVLVNAFLITIWAVTGAGFFWPIFPLAGWGIGLIMNAWDVWRGDDFTEAQISREVERMQQPH